MPGIAEGHREVALGRDTLVRPAAEPVEPEPEGGQRRDDVAILLDRERAPERMLGREVQGRLADRDRDDRIDQLGQAGLPAALLRRVVRQPRRGPGHGRRVAAQEQEDDRRLTCPQGGGQRVAVGLVRSPGPTAAGRCRPVPVPAAAMATGTRAACSSATWASTQSATASRAATHAGLGGLGLDPRGIGLQRQDARATGRSPPPPRVRGSR